MEIWGGGGVPADDGPPLGLSWELMGTRHVNIDEFEHERVQSRTPKDSYCVEGCMEPNLRRQMLLAAGSTHKQIKAATRVVAQINAGYDLAILFVGNGNYGSPHAPPGSVKHDF